MRAIEEQMGRKHMRWSEVDSFVLAAPCDPESEPNALGSKQGNQCCLFAFAGSLVYMKPEGARRAVIAVSCFGIAGLRKPLCLLSCRGGCTRSALPLCQVYIRAAPFALQLPMPQLQRVLGDAGSETIIRCTPKSRRPQVDTAI